MEELLAEVNVCSGAGPAELDRLADDQRTLLVQVRKLWATLWQAKIALPLCCSISRSRSIIILQSTFYSRRRCVQHRRLTCKRSTHSHCGRGELFCCLNHGSTWNSARMEWVQSSGEGKHGEKIIKVWCMCSDSTHVIGVCGAVLAHRRCLAMTRRCFFRGDGGADGDGDAARGYMMMVDSGTTRQLMDDDGDSGISKVRKDTQDWQQYLRSAWRMTREKKSERCSRKRESFLGMNRAIDTVRGALLKEKRPLSYTVRFDVVVCCCCGCCCCCCSVVRDDSQNEFKAVITLLQLRFEKVSRKTFVGTWLPGNDTG